MSSYIAQKRFKYCNCVPGHPHLTLRWSCNFLLVSDTRKPTSFFFKKKKKLSIRRNTCEALVGVASAGSVVPTVVTSRSSLV